MVSSVSTELFKGKNRQRQGLLMTLTCRQIEARSSFFLPHSLRTSFLPGILLGINGQNGHGRNYLSSFQPSDGFGAERPFLFLLKSPPSCQPQSCRAPAFFWRFRSPAAPDSIMEASAFISESLSHQLHQSPVVLEGSALHS